MMNQGITVNGLHSFRDFGLTISSKNVTLPPKKVIRETVPFANGSYDFSKMSGEINFGDRQANYTFDIVASSIVEMQKLRSDVASWIMMVHEAKIFDDDYPGYHFLGSYTSNSWHEDSEYGEASFTFDCYPFLISNDSKVYSMATGTHELTNNGSHRAIPTIHCPFEATIQIGDDVYSFSPGTYNDSGIVLEVGMNIWSTISDGIITVTFYEEVL